MRLASRVIFSLLVGGNLLLANCAPPSPPSADREVKPAAAPRARGLNQPTAQEQARLDEIAPKDPPQTPNALARARLNAERAARGLPPLPPDSPGPPVK